MHFMKISSSNQTMLGSIVQSCTTFFNKKSYVNSLNVCHVVQCSNLLGEEDRTEFLEDISDEYEEIREEHYDNLKVS